MILMKLVCLLAALGDACGQLADWLGLAGLGWLSSTWLFIPQKASSGLFTGWLQGSETVMKVCKASRGLGWGLTQITAFHWPKEVPKPICIQGWSQ